MPYLSGFIENDLQDVTKYRQVIERHIGFGVVYVTRTIQQSLVPVSPRLHGDQVVVAAPALRGMCSDTKG